ncbi:MAG: hypothetical protein V3R93_00930 [Candidatus Hydrothermarchaeaceae archaeon]
MQPKNRNVSIVDIYLSLIGGIKEYDQGSLGKVIDTQIKKSVLEFSKKYPDIFSVDVNEEIKIQAKSGASERDVVEALNDLYSTIRNRLKEIMGEAGDGILRNAGKGIYKERLSEIKDLRIEFPGWFRDQMQKAIWIDCMIKVFKG